VKFKFIYREYRDKAFTILDVGCGNHSPTATKKWFPKCRYFGIDKSIYNNDQRDIDIAEKFYNIDLCKENLEDIPENFFDIIIMSHVIEHIPNGIAVIEELTRKLKHGGKIYIEYPSVKSLSLPRVDGGSLHFCDDNSHIRLYDLKEICNALLANGMKIIKAGTRRDPAGILLLPAIIMIKWLRGEPLTGFGLWDLLGFAEFVYAEKK